MHTSYLLNGSYQDALTPSDRGLAYGDGVFRTLVVRKGVPEGWRRHYRKLHLDCAALAIQCPAEEDLLGDIRLLAADDEQVVVKLMVTRGEGRRGYAPDPGMVPTRIALKSPMPQYPQEHFSVGVDLYLCQTRLAIQPRLAGIKHLNRLENVLARMEWNDERHAEGLLLDQSGFVVECTASNIFMREGDLLLTPDLQDCGVAGVTRDRILALASELGLQAKITRRRLEEVLTADEVIICNSVYGVWQVRSLHGRHWQRGELADRLMEWMRKENALSI